MTSPVIAIEDLLPRLGRHQRLVGIDLGTKTIGLLRTILARFDVAALVVGLPLNMDGTEGPRAQSTRAFVRQSAPALLKPVVFWDERLSTAAVTRNLIAQDVSRARRAEVVDRAAAAYILQGALDRLQRLPPSNDT